MEEITKDGEQVCEETLRASGPIRSLGRTGGRALTSLRLSEHNNVVSGDAHLLFSEQRQIKV